MDGHFILCGLGKVGARVLNYLRAVGGGVVVIDGRCDPADPRLHGVSLVRGDCRQPEVLRQAGIERAAGVLVLTSDDLVNLAAALRAHQLNPAVRVVARMFNPNLVERLGRAARNVTALSTSALTGPLLALLARTGETLGGFTLENGTKVRVAEVVVRAGSPLRDVRLGGVPVGQHVLLLGHRPRGGDYRFAPDVDGEARLEAGDRLLLCGEPEYLYPLRARGEEPAEPRLLVPGLVSRYARVVARTVAAIDLPVKVCAGVLVAVIAVSTLVFHLGMRNDTLPDAFYRTISVMATVADMGLEELEPEGWQKVFVGLLRLTGAALVAAFTAILTNYLVRAQLAGALEARRIPDGGHVVVCGLGNVGCRVVDELLRDGVHAVVIERDRDNPFIRAVRQRGVPVLVGDARLPAALGEAHAAKARAVVVVTSDELANLEVGLHARELNPALRVVLRLTDADLAQTLREEADFRLAVSLPDLAAPAFVAALFGDRVHSVFYVNGRLLAAVDLTVRPGDAHLIDVPVRALAVDYRLHPIAIVGTDGTTRTFPAQARLGVGDRLTVIVDLVDLQKLLRREAPPAGWGVEVLGFPLPARPYVVQTLRRLQPMSQEEAERCVGTTPLRVADRLTRGHAEDLYQLLTRERVQARLVNGG